jgi:alcohol dehydrogenase
MLVPVIQFNMIGNLNRFAEIAEIFQQPLKSLSPRQAAQSCVDALIDLAEDLRVPRNLSAFGVREEHLPELAKGVMKVTRLLTNNPRKLEQSDAEAIYRSVL